MTVGKHELYRTWNGMRQRCLNPKSPQYKNYGERGIRVCERWRNSFQDFLDDMEPRPKNHTLERINNAGHYEPSNCRWATQSAQSRNTRVNHIIIFNNESRCMTEWAEISNLTVGIIRTRLRLGWSIEKTLTTPARWKLKPSQIEEIRARLAPRNGAKLAREFCVSRATISLIRNGIIWR